MPTRITRNEENGKKYLFSTEWLNVAEAARYMGLSRGCIYNWIQKGTAPTYYKHRQLIRFKKSDLDKFMEGNRVDPKR